MKEFYESGNEGSINTKNFSEFYGANKIYYWAITVPEGKLIEVRFQEVDLEFSTDCLKDFLKIHDGRSINDALLGTYCGKSQPAIVKSSGRHLYLYFQSDGSRERRGFRLSWRALNIFTTTMASTTSVQTTTVKKSEGTRTVLIILSAIICKKFENIVLLISYDHLLCETHI